MNYEGKSVIKTPILPKNGDTGGVDPAGEPDGEAGGDPLPADGLPVGFKIMMLRVTFTAASDKSSLFDLPISLSDPANQIQIPISSSDQTKRGEKEKEERKGGELG